MILPLVDPPEVLGHVVHYVLGVDLLRAQNVNVVILPSQCPVLSPAVLRFITSNLLDGSRVILQPGERTLVLDWVCIAIPLDFPGV